MTSEVEISKTQKVAVIGAGQAGRRFALRCALAGFDVVLEDVMPANLRRAEAEFADLSGQGKLSFALTVEDAVRDADIAVDFVPDELESKLEIFCLIDRMAPPKTILCTPSEALSITDLASCTYRPDRCFAIRGNLTTPSTLRLLHPTQSPAALIEELKAFFTTLNSSIIAAPDPNPPMLMKNITPSNPTQTPSS